LTSGPGCGGNARIGQREGTGEPARSRRIREAKRVSRLYLELCIEFLNHNLTHSEYESVVISALAVMGIRADNG